MSELKHQLMLNKERSWVPCYLKSEADKVIAELEDKLQSADKQIENLINSASSIMLFQDRGNDDKCAELRHSDYKRCLAMARWCRIHDEFTQLESERLGLSQRALFIEYRRKAMWWNKWYKRWLELAEKFKEAK